jgi:hypothetical protein
MSSWDDYPSNYREREIKLILEAAGAGECAAITGLSGSGKSNLLGFLAHRQAAVRSKPGEKLRFVLIDLNRLSAPGEAAFFDLVGRCLPEVDQVSEMGRIEDLRTLDLKIAAALHEYDRLCLMFDRFDVLADLGNQTLFSKLRALRDAHKYRLTYVIAGRKALDAQNELAELFFAHTLWLGALVESDAAWSIRQYMSRKRLAWELETIRKIIDLSWGYPSFLRAVCEAHAAGVELETGKLLHHPALNIRLAEFWSDAPTQEDLEHSGLSEHPFLATTAAPLSPGEIDTGKLTALENRLLAYFQEHPNRVCEKDELIRAVWPEDKIYEQGIRDDSLAQLVRRLRKKIEVDDADPQLIQTVPGRGYRFTA